jgi:hypothetical protein
MSKINNAKKETVSFEERVKSLVGPKSYKKLPLKDKQVIREMDKCQRQGGPIGSAVIPNTSI